MAQKNATTRGKVKAKAPAKAAAKTSSKASGKKKASPIDQAKAALKKEAKKPTSSVVSKKVVQKAGQKASIEQKTTEKAPPKAVSAAVIPAPTKTAGQVSAAAPEKTKPAAKRGRKISIDVSAGEAVSALAAKWAALNKKSEQIESKPYSMRGVFEEKTAIVHKVLGWGYILANRNDRLEVLFKDGIKYLISNYKS